jgi:hypothetical protein
VKVRGSVLKIFRDLTEEPPYRMTVKLSPDDGAAGSVEMPITQAEYEKFARSWTEGPFEVEVDLKFDKPQPT